MPDIETPEADAAEQQQPVTEEEPDVEAGDPPIEAAEGDVAESLREVPLDDDDYR
jgi:hypothetical protein